MYKKLMGILLCIVLSGSVFAGCALIEHNDEKDAKQIVAVIDPIKEYNSKGELVFESEKKVIYKSELIQTMNQYAQTYVQNYNLTLKEATERLLNEMITRELLLIEAERIEKQNLIKWTQKDHNDVTRSVYAAIDNQIAALKKEIMGEYDETAGDNSQSEEKETTYPTMPDETTDEDYTDYARDEYNNIIYEKDENGNFVYEKDENGEDKLDENGNKIKIPTYIVWAPEEKDYPCLWGSEEQKSLDREAVQRFVSLLKQAAANDLRVTKADKEKFKQDDKDIDAVVAAKGWSGVYPMLGSTHYVQYLLAKNAQQSVAITKLQNYITDGVDVSDKEVADAYNSQMAYQTNTYKNDASAYQTAVSGGETTILYFRDSSYFFVKHILLPFSDEQTAQLKAFKADPKNDSQKYKAYRDAMVNDIVVYPHVNGENDTEHPTTVQNVFDAVKAAVLGCGPDVKKAERTFDRYIYDYNTDPGAFGQGKQYAVKRGDEDGHSGYMEEFYDGAMELATKYKEGDVLDSMVVTDYGVHIMYFSQNVVGGSRRGIDDPITPGAYSTVREELTKTIRTSKENEAFSVWQNERITYYQESAGVVHTYAKRYKSLYAD
jgi:hypothetical protein